MSGRDIAQRDRLRCTPMIAVALLLLCASAIAPAEETTQERFRRLRALAAAQSNLTLREQYLAEALKLALEVENPRLQAVAHDQLARVAILAGDYTKSLKHFVQAGTILRRIQDRRLLAVVMEGMGTLQYEHGNYEEAVESLNQAIAVHKYVTGQAGTPAALACLGLALAKVGRGKEGLALVEESLELARKAGSQREVERRLVYLGMIHAELGNHEKAVAMIEDGLRKVRVKPSAAFVSLASAYYHVNRLDDTIDITNRRLRRLGEEGGSDAGRRQLALLYWRARAYHAQGLIDAATTDMLRAMRILEEMRIRLLPVDRMKRGFADAHRQVSDLAVELLSVQQRHRDALEIAEQWRARALLDLLASRQERGPATRRAQKSLERLMAAFDEPALLSSGSSGAASIDGIVKTAARLRSTVLAYRTTERAVYIWVITPDGRVEAGSTAIPSAELESLIKRTQRHGFAPDRAAWQRLHRALIGPVQKFLPSPGALLTILPHGPLMSLPFAALADARGRYLIESYALHSAPAAALFEFTQPRHADGESGIVLVGDPVRPPKLPDGRPLPPLNGARLELAAIAAAVPKHGLVLLQGANATVDGVRRGVGPGTVLHFATHSVVDAAAPFDSFLALSNGERLSAAEVYAWDKAADLVVLSSCRGAAGPISADGVLGLTRAFLYAGSRSVIASVWDVPDATAPTLLSRFYRSLTRARNKAFALRSAQLSLIEDLRQNRVSVATPAGPALLPENPVLWAGFFLQGEPD